jgi:DNA modification methylase
MGLGRGATLLDPFCGAGTTLVEGRLSGLRVIGVDANPVAVLATRVKTRWSVRPEQLLAALGQVVDLTHRDRRRIGDYSEDPTYRYLSDHGLVERGWISTRPLRRSLSIKSAIERIEVGSGCRDAMRLALISSVVRCASNVRFGPELYCGPRKYDAPVVNDFANRGTLMAMDLNELRVHAPRSVVTLGDSRKLNRALRGVPLKSVDAVVCSPPYPTEHDYTRNTRLELAFLEEVRDISSLRAHKRRMLRSHTKGIYFEDAESTNVSRVESIQLIKREIDKRVADRSHGFARLYSRVITEYFGGMYNHFRSLRPYLKSGATAAYVVGDQASYANVPVRTAEILAELAESAGFEVIQIEVWRERRASTTSRRMDEHVLHLRKPAGARR